MTGPVHVHQLTVAPQTAPPPDADAGAAAKLARRQLEDRREHGGLEVRVHVRPRGLAAQMRCGEVPAAAGVEQVLDPVVVEEERIAPAAGEERVVTGGYDVRSPAEGYRGTVDDLCPGGFGRAGLRPGGDIDVKRLPAGLRRGKNVRDRQVVEEVPVVVDREAVDRVGMKRVGVRVRVEDENGTRRIGGRLECVKIAEIEPLVAQGRAQAEAGEVVRHQGISPIGAYGPLSADYSPALRHTRGPDRETADGGRGGRRRHQLTARPQRRGR